MDRPRPDIARTLLAVLFLAGLIGAGVWIIYPFLSALIWATLLVVATWSLMLGVQARLWGRRGLAVLVMTAGVLLVVIVPLAFAVSTILHNVDQLAVRMQEIKEWTVPPPPEWAERVPLVGERLAQRWQEFAALEPEQLRAQLQPYSKDIARWILQKAGNLAVFFLHLVLTAIIAAVLYLKGDTAAEGVRAFARRLAGTRGDQITVLAAQAIRAVALGVIVTAVVVAAMSGIGFAAAGIPLAALLTALIFVMAVAQLGPGPVLLAATFWLYWKDQTLVATVFLIWSILIGAVDHVLRPILINRGADLPLALIFAGVVGGLIAFGAMGLFIGPVMLAVAYRLLEGWVHEGQRTGEPD